MKRSQLYLTDCEKSVLSKQILDSIKVTSFSEKETLVIWSFFHNKNVIKRFVLI